MGKGSLFFGVSLFSLLLIVNFVSAVDTVIQIETYPNHDVMIDFLKLSPLQNLQTIKANSGSTGKTQITFTTTETKFNMNVFIKSGNEILIQHRFDDNLPGKNIKLVMFQDRQEITEFVADTASNGTILNDTVQNETIIEDVPADILEEDSAEANVGITGLAADTPATDVPRNNTPYYIIGGAVLLAIIIFIVLKIRKKNSWTGPSDVKVRKLSDPHGEKEKMSNYTKAIEDAERKINEAQAEIRKIKNQDRISEMRNRIEKEQSELKKLEKGEF